MEHSVDPPGTGERGANGSLRESPAGFPLAKVEAVLYSDDGQEKHCYAIAWHRQAFRQIADLVIFAQNILQKAPFKAPFEG